MSQGFTNKLAIPLSSSQGGTGSAGTGFIDLNGNVLFSFTSTPSAVNYISFLNNTTGSAPAISALGADANVTLQLNGKGTGGVAIYGVSTNSSAAIGEVGEYISSEILLGSAVSLTTATPANITSISLTAGDWDVWGSIVSAPNAATTTQSILGWISTTSATLPTAPNSGSEAILQISIGAGLAQQLPIGLRRLSLSSTTTVYLSIQSSFLINTMSAYGFIGARRVR